MRFITKLLILMGLLATSMVAAGQTPAPTVFFTDLTSGPAASNSDPTYAANAGAYVTIYGNNFESSQGSSTVTLNGNSCLTVVSWGGTWMWYQKIVVQIGTSCTTGTFVVTVNGQASSCADIGNLGNNCQFTVRSGNIYYVSTTGNDSTGTGSFSHPWATVLKARNTMSPGDITYAENGICQCTDDGSGWSTTFLLDSEQGTSGNPMAMVAYPGATVTIGNTSAVSNLIGIRTKGNSGTGQSYWVFAGLTIRGYDEAIAPNLLSQGSNTVPQPGYWRLIGNDISCPNGNTESGCMDTIDLVHTNFLGNNAHDMGAAGATAEYQGIYFSTDSNHFEVAWNTISNVLSCRGFQSNSTVQASGTGHDLYDLTVHDNVIHDTQCDAIVLNDVDPSQGVVRVYNNVIYNAGKGNTPENSGDWSCVYVPGATEAGPTGSGNVEIYNNSFYNCGPNPSPPYGNSNACVNNGGDNSAINLHMRNNICYETNSGVQLYYVAQSGSGTDGVYGVNNIMYGIGTPPSSSVVTGTINSNPLYVSTSTPNLELSSASSPAIGASDTTGLVPTYDINGLPRPSPPAIGAYEYQAGTGPAQPGWTLNGVNLKGLTVQ